jgi:signal transduction histidine kinase
VIDIVLAASDKDFALKYWTAGCISLLLLIQVILKTYQTQSSLNERQEIMNSILMKMNKIIAHNIRGPVANLPMQIQVGELLGQEELIKLKPSVENLIHTLDSVLSVSLQNEEMKVKALVDVLREQFQEVLFISNQTDEMEVSSGSVVLFSLQNFISNAIKFNSNLIRVVFYELEGQLVITVEDNGMGMTESELNKLGSVVHSDMGKGMGLSLSIELLSMYGYHFAVDSAPNMGTQVLIAPSIPAALAFVSSARPFRIIEPKELAVD